MDDSRWMGCSLRLMSRRMVVFGAQSSNASRSCANSCAKYRATRSSAIKSRSDQGIYGKTSDCESLWDRRT